MQADCSLEALPNLSLSYLIYWANSLVGAKTKTIGPSPLLTVGWALMWTIAGNKYARVFPEPV